MPQTWAPWVKAEQAGSGGEPCSSSTLIPKEQRGQVCLILLSSFTNWGVENLLHAMRPAKGKGQQSFSTDRVQSYTGTAALSATLLQGGCWSPSPILPIIPDINLGPQLSFSPLNSINCCNSSLLLHQSLRQSFIWFCRKPNQSLPPPAPAPNYFAAQSTHLRLAAPGSGQLTLLPQSSAVGSFLPARVWALLGRLVQQPRSPRVPGRRQALPSTNC